MDYIRNIIDSVTTIFEGLTITASHLFRKPITIQYPDRLPVPVKEMLPLRYRGFLNVDTKICTACTLCMQACPIQCIKIDVTKPPTRLLTKFNIDIGLCMFCGLCTEACPTGAIHFTREFERATPNLGELVFKFVDEGHPVVPYKKGSV